MNENNSKISECLTEGSNEIKAMGSFDTNGTVIDATIIKSRSNKAIPITLIFDVVEGKCKI